MTTDTLAQISRNANSRSTGVQGVLIKVLIKRDAGTRQAWAAIHAAILANYLLVSPKIVSGRDDLAGTITCGEFVAQISNLPHRRLPVGRPFDWREGGGLEIRDPAGWKPALLWLRLRRAAKYLGSEPQGELNWISCWHCRISRCSL